LEAGDIGRFGLSCASLSGSCRGGEDELAPGTSLGFNVAVALTSASSGMATSIGDDTLLSSEGRVLLLAPLVMTTDIQCTREGNALPFCSEFKRGNGAAPC
jgi:hypothetical protein